MVSKFTCKIGGGDTFMMRRNQVGQSYYYSHLSYPLLLFLPSCPILLFLPVLPYPISLFLPILSFIRDQDVRVQVHNLSSEHGKCKTVKARFWSWLSGKSLFNILRCSLFVRKRLVAESGGWWVRLVYLGVYRGTSLIRKRHPAGPYRRTIPRALWCS